MFNAMVASSRRAPMSWQQPGRLLIRQQAAGIILLPQDLAVIVQDRGPKFQDPAALLVIKLPGPG